MLQFVNGFSSAVDSENGDVIIKFLQQSPNFDDENNNVIVEEVANIVLGKSTAQKLSDALTEILSNEEP